MSEKRFIMEDGVLEDGATGEAVSLYGIDDLLNEQQDIISQLQDLCGETDGENAKLRIENKKLKEMNEQLRKKNKQIGFLKRDLFILLNLIKDNPMEHNLDYIKIRERWE